MEEQKRIFDQSLNEEKAIPEKRNNEKIVAYVFGKYLYCVKCHKEAKNRIKGRSGEIDIHNYSRTEDEVGVFICGSCGKIFGKTLEGILPRLTTGEENILATWLENRGGKRTPQKEAEQDQNKLMGGKYYLTDLADMVDHCGQKVRFISDFFNHSIPEDEFFSEKGIAGLHFILRNIEDDLEFVVDEIYEENKDRKIKEVE